MLYEEYLKLAGDALAYGRTTELAKYMRDDCFYHSDYAPIDIKGAGNIINNMDRVYSVINENNRYHYQIVPSADVCKKGQWNGHEECLLLYQYGDCLTSIVTVELDDRGMIEFILLSRNEKIYNVDFYDFTIGPDSPKDVPQSAFDDNDDDTLYIWKRANNFMRDFFFDNGYAWSYAEVFDDCISYKCSKNGHKYALYMFAFGQNKTVELNGDYCVKFKDYELSKDRTVLIMQLNVQKSKHGHTYEYNVKSCYGTDNIEIWKVGEIDDRNVLIYYPFDTIDTKLAELMYAFNNNSIDIYDMIISENNPILVRKRGTCLDNAIFSSLKYFHTEHGDMEPCYISFNKTVYSKTLYINSCGYVNFNVTNAYPGKIAKIEIKDYDNLKDVIKIPKEQSKECINPIRDFPALVSIKTPEKGDERFTLKMKFSNGEKRIYRLPINGEGEVIHYGNYVFTDKIWGSAQISQHRQKPLSIAFNSYDNPGQGIDFINGYSISALRCYNDSEPYFENDDDIICFNEIRNFNEDSYGGEEKDVVMDYLPNLQTKCLIDKRRKIIRKIPQKYQNTPEYIYPPCGGVKDDLVMVSELGGVDLRYHHDLGAEAGMWGWLDFDLNEVISPKYIFASHFYDGKAIVCKGEWNIDDKGLYWCDNERWGMIDKEEREIIPFIFDELNDIGNTDRLYYGHTGGWDDGHYCVYDTEQAKIILELDFDFDIHYMFNDCYTDRPENSDNILVFDEHLPGEEKDLISIYSLDENEWKIYRGELKGRTFNGETKKTVTTKDGEDIVIF